MILLINDLLQKQGCTGGNADGNADVDILRFFFVLSSEYVHTTVIGEDTDLRILLLY